MSIRMHPGLASAVERLSGTSYTQNLHDEMISAWMKTKKVIEDNKGESCMGAPLFMKKIFDWYHDIDDQGKYQYLAHDHEVYNFYYRTDTMEIIKDNKLLSDESVKPYIERNNGWPVDSLVCLCMGYVPHMGSQSSQAFSGFMHLVEAFGVYLWYVIESDKFKKYMDSIKVSWRDTMTWKDIHDCKYDFRIDLSYESDLDLTTFFETFGMIENCDGLINSAANNIRNIFNQNSKFFKRMEKELNREDCYTISECYWLDLWFTYVWSPSLKRNCYYEN